MSEYLMDDTTAPVLINLEDARNRLRRPATALVHRISWEEIRKVWFRELWPKRSSPVEPTSAMVYPGDGVVLPCYDLGAQKFPPTFFGIYVGIDSTAHSGVLTTMTLVAVNSGHRTSQTDYRSRGLWVDPRFRRIGLAQRLLRETAAQAKAEGCTRVWTVPRRDSLQTYIGARFKRTSEFFDEGMEFGPNCYAVREVRS